MYEFFIYVNWYINCGSITETTINQRKSCSECVNNNVDPGGKPLADISCGQYSTEQDIRTACNTHPDCKGYSMRKYDGNRNFRPWCLKDESENSRIGSINEIYKQKLS